MQLRNLILMLLLLLSSQSQAQDTWREYKLTRGEDELQVTYNQPRYVDICFYIQEPVDATLEILDVSGKTVATLHQGLTGSAGVRWNASKVSRGIYYARLTKPGSVVSKKLTIVN